MIRSGLVLSALALSACGADAAGPGWSSAPPVCPNAGACEPCDLNVAEDVSAGDGEDVAGDDIPGVSIDAAGDAGGAP